MQRMQPTIIRIIAISVILVAIGQVNLAEGQTKAPTNTAAVQKAEAFFRESVNDSKRLPLLLAGLKSTDDKDLLPLFAAWMKSADKRVRLLATSTVAEIDKKQAIPLLMDRLFHDKVMVVRSKALVELDRLNAISAAQLVKVLAVDDEEMQLLAARALGRKGQSRQATATLQKLTQSNDQHTACFARMTLLGAGDRRQFGRLRQVILDPKTPQSLQKFLAQQIQEERILAALPLTETLTRAEKSNALRIQAYMAIAEIDPKATYRLAQAIRATKSDNMQINLMRLLANRKDATLWLETFAKGKNLLAKVAKFELTRSQGGMAAQAALKNMLTPAHPILVEYALGRLRDDLKTHKPTMLNYYVKPMNTLLTDTDLTPGRMTRTHDRLATVVELVSNINTREALISLYSILKDSQSLSRRSLVAGALYRSQSPHAGKLVKPLLNSGYSELRLFAALRLGREANPAAMTALQNIQSQTARQQTDVLTMANWYILKTAGQTKPVIKRLAAMVK